MPLKPPDRGPQEVDTNHRLYLVRLFGTLASFAIPIATGPGFFSSVQDIVGNIPPRDFANMAYAFLGAISFYLIMYDIKFSTTTGETDNQALRLDSGNALISILGFMATSLGL